MSKTVYTCILRVCDIEKCLLGVHFLGAVFLLILDAGQKTTKVYGRIEHMISPHGSVNLSSWFAPSKTCCKDEVNRQGKDFQHTLGEPLL